MGKTKLINIELDDQTLGYLKGKRDQVIASTRTLELASQNVAWALKDFHSDYAAIMGNVSNMSEEKIAQLQELKPESLPHLALIMNKCSEDQKVKANKKQKADPNMPKKPMTVFLAFSTDQRAVIRGERLSQGLPALASSHMATEVTRLWADLPEERKTKYREQYQERLAAYRINKAAYLAKTGVVPKPTKAAKTAVKVEKVEEEEDEDDDEDESFADALENPEEAEEEEEEEEEEQPPKKKRATKSK